MSVSFVSALPKRSSSCNYVYALPLTAKEVSVSSLDGEKIPMAKSYRRRNRLMPSVSPTRSSALRSWNPQCPDDFLLLPMQRIKESISPAKSEVPVTADSWAHFDENPVVSTANDFSIDVDPFASQPTNNADALLDFNFGAFNSSNNNNSSEGKIETTNAFLLDLFAPLPSVAPAPASSSMAATATTTSAASATVSNSSTAASDPWVSMFANFDDAFGSTSATVNGPATGVKQEFDAFAPSVAITNTGMEMDSAAKATSVSPLATEQAKGLACAEASELQVAIRESVITSERGKSIVKSDWTGQINAKVVSKRPDALATQRSNSSTNPNGPADCPMELRMSIDPRPSLDTESKVPLVTVTGSNNGNNARLKQCKPNAQLSCVVVDSHTSPSTDEAVHTQSEPSENRVKPLPTLSMTFAIRRSQLALTNANSVSLGQYSLEADHSFSFWIVQSKVQVLEAQSLGRVIVRVTAHPSLLALVQRQQPLAKTRPQQRPSISGPTPSASAATVLSIRGLKIQLSLAPLAAKCAIDVAGLTPSTGSVDQDKHMVSWSSGGGDITRFDKKNDFRMEFQVLFRLPRMLSTAQQAQMVSELTHLPAIPINVKGSLDNLLVSELSWQSSAQCLWPVPAEMPLEDTDIEQLNKANARLDELEDSALHRARVSIRSSDRVFAVDTAVKTTTSTHFECRYQ